VKEVSGSPLGAPACHEKKDCISKLRGAKHILGERMLPDHTVQEMKWIYVDISFTQIIVKELIHCPTSVPVRL
jgi:hypothetical protein